MISKKRHIAKAITWRAIATISTILITWLVTGEFESGLTVGGLGVIIKLILYYFHERVWYRRIKFGVNKQEEKL